MKSRHGKLERERAKGIYNTSIQLVLFNIISSSLDLFFNTPPPNPARFDLVDNDHVNQSQRHAVHTTTTTTTTAMGMPSTTGCQLWSSPSSSSMEYRPRRSALSIIVNLVRTGSSLLLIPFPQSPYPILHPPRRQTRKQRQPQTKPRPLSIHGAHLLVKQFKLSSDVLRIGETMARTNPHPRTHSLGRTSLLVDRL